jgi:hypothetical protein
LKSSVITTSAAFFRSTELRQTGGLVRDFYVASLDRPLTNNMPDYVEFTLLIYIEVEYLLDKTRFVQKPTKLFLQ